MVRRSRYVPVTGTNWGVLVDQYGGQRMPRRNELLRTSNPPYQVVRSRPVEHERTGHVRGDSFVSPTIVNRGRFRQALALDQSRAEPIYHKNKTYYKIGGIVLTRGQVLEGRWRAGELQSGRRLPKKVVGL